MLLKQTIFAALRLGGNLSVIAIGIRKDARVLMMNRTSILLSSRKGYVGTFFEEALYFHNHHSERILENRNVHREERRVVKIVCFKYLHYHKVHASGECR